MSSSSLELKNIWFTICKVTTSSSERGQAWKYQINHISYCLNISILFYLQKYQKILNKNKTINILTVYCFNMDCTHFDKYTILALVSKVLKIH